MSQTKPAETHASAGENGCGVLVVCPSVPFSEISKLEKCLTQTFDLTAGKEDPSTSSKDPLMNACGDLDDDDEEMEQEEMYVDPHESIGHKQREWGGPTRGGRLAEPTRFGDWERKGRCTDF